jgi:uncharacterized damage-inducible protein DinB
MQLSKAINETIHDLKTGLSALDQQLFATPCTQLSDATVGQHVRHIIELFQCLLDGYEQGLVNYEKRKRNKTIETDYQFALQLLDELTQAVDRADKPLMMEATYAAATMTISSNYYRELAYNLEHTVHHMALIRIGIRELSDVTLSGTFGVASSTIQYHKTCAQ